MTARLDDTRTGWQWQVYRLDELPPSPGKPEPPAAAFPAVLPPTPMKYGHSRGLPPLPGAGESSIV